MKCLTRNDVYTWALLNFAEHKRASRILHVECDANENEETPATFSPSISSASASTRSMGLFKLPNERRVTSRRVGRFEKRKEKRGKSGDSLFCYVRYGMSQEMLRFWSVAIIRWNGASVWRVSSIQKRRIASFEFWSVDGVHLAEAIQRGQKIYRVIKNVRMLRLPGTSNWDDFGDNKVEHFISFVQLEHLVRWGFVLIEFTSRQSFNWNCLLSVKKFSNYYLPFYTHSTLG